MNIWKVLLVAIAFGTFMPHPTQYIYLASPLIDWGTTSRLPWQLPYNNFGYDDFTHTEPGDKYHDEVERFNLCMNSFIPKLTEEKTMYCANEIFGYKI